MQKGKVTKSEVLLLGITAVFLCGLLLLSRHDRTAEPGITVETEKQITQEEVQPDLSPLNLNTATAEELQELPENVSELLADSELVDESTALTQFFDMQAENITELLSTHKSGKHYIF